MNCRGIEINAFFTARKFAKVTFSQVSVCLSTVGGVSVSVGGSHSQGFSVQGGRSMSRGSLPGGGSVTETPRMVTSGRYVSYWNAFLVNVILLNKKVFQSNANHPLAESTTIY